MKGGHAGKILRVDLTSKTIDTIPTEKYEQWVGGYGMGLAVFFDEVDKDYITDTHDKTGFEPENIVGLFSGPLQGTLSPNGGRTEVVGMAPENYPRPQFCRGNFGGKFSAMMKFAGYDGIIVKGASEKPVWINVIDDVAKIEDATGVWGLDTYETQEEIWRRVNNRDYKDWMQNSTTRDSGRTTQRPAVVAMGPAGERLVRMASLVHEEGHGNGQGGFVAVFGSKKLKAISFLGTGSVPIADPQALFETRMWYKSHSSVAKPGATYGNWGTENYGRALSCYGCDRGCYANFDTGGKFIGAGNMCVDQYYSQQEDMNLHGGKITDVNVEATTWMQRYGINAYELATGMALLSSPKSMEFRQNMSWLQSLHERGILGDVSKGAKFESDLDFSQVGTKEFHVGLLRKIAYREGIGDDLAEGIVRAAKKWGVLESDLLSGLLPMIYWEGEVHWGTQVWWAYASIFQARDINRHMLTGILHGPKIGANASIPAEVRAERLAEIAGPWHDELTGDLSENGVYSIHMAHLVAWSTRYSKMYEDSSMLCDFNTPLLFEAGAVDGKGMTPEYETRFFNAITGMNITYDEGLDIGRRIYNFERAVMALHGRHRNEEYWPPYPPYDSYVYHEKPGGFPYLQNYKAGGPPAETYLVFKDGKWTDDVCEFPFDKAKMDEFKTIYYELEGWDTATGLPTRKTLEDLDLKFVADELDARGKLPG